MYLLYIIIGINCYIIYNQNQQIVELKNKITTLETEKDFIFIE